MCCRYRENIIIPSNLGPVKIKTNEEKMIETIFESCFFKSFMACVLGEDNNGFLTSYEKFKITAL